MKVVAVINYKGGVGKTSLTTNLASQLAWEGKKVLVLDLDAQASLTFSFIAPEDWVKSYEPAGTIKAWFDAFEAGAPIGLDKLVFAPSRVNQYLKGSGSGGRLDVIFSHLGLINVDLELATKLGGSTLEQGKRNFLAIHRRLSAGLAAMEKKYDVILIDCPPNFNIVTKTAIVASDFILVPARPDYLSTLGIDYLMRSVGGLIKDYNDYANLALGEKVTPIHPKMLGVVFTMIQEYANQPIASQRTFMSQVRARKDVTVFKAYIKRNDTLFADAPQTGIPVVLNAYKNGSHQSVVDGLEDVAAEISKALGI